MAEAMHWYVLSEEDGVVDTAAPTSKQQPQNQNLLVPTLRGLAYGDGFFTTMGVHYGQVLWSAYHKARLQSHLKALYLCLPNVEQTLLWQTVNEFAAHIEHGIIKIVVTRKAQQQRGYAYAPALAENSCLVWVGVQATDLLATEVADFLMPDLKQELTAFKSLSGKVILQQPAIVATCLESQLACLPSPLAGLKSLNRLDSVLAAGELERRKQSIPNLGEGLVQDMNGNWVEGVMSNVFYQLKAVSGTPSVANQWYTPPIEHSGVKGVMRQVIIDRLKAQKIPIQQRYLKNEDLNHIETLFFCNAVRGVIPVQTLKRI